MTKCPQCGALTSASQRFCGECGTRLQEAGPPQPADDRNAVPHRPGGGRPDPWEVGATDSVGELDDDFFSRYRSKSATEDDLTPRPAQPRRTRRRFDPDLDGDATAAMPPSAPPLFPQRTDESTATPAPTPPRAAPAPATPPTSPFADRSGAGQAPQSAARDRARQEQVDRERRAAEERAQQVQAVQEQQTARAEAERQRFQRQQAPGQPAPGQQAQEQQAGDPRLPWLPPVDPSAEPPTSQSFSEPDDATFTQLIKGLDDDPADKPIVADGLDKTGIVPLPPREQDAGAGAPPAERPAQQRAAEFYGTAPVTPQNQQKMPALPPLSADENAPKSPFNSPFVAEATTRQAAQRAPEQSAPGAAEPRGTDSKQRSDDEEQFWPFGDEFDEEPAAPQARNRSESGAGSVAAAPTAAASAAASGPAPGYDFGQGGGIGGSGRGGSGSGRGGSGGSGGPGRESEQQRRGLKTILIAAAAAVVVIVGAFAISGLFRGGDEEAPVADSTQQEQSEETVEQPADPETGEQTPTQETETQQAADFEPVAFQSGSGNLRCQITPEGGAACQIMEQDFYTPDEACVTGDAAGTAVGVNTEGITWPCLTSNFDGGDVVDYDEPVTAGEYTCSISFSTGVSCENANAASFTLEFSAGIDTNGDTASEPQFDLEPIE